MTSYLRVLTTASVDSSPCIVLTGRDGTSIVIDCGEGCQRSFIEANTRVGSVRTFCVTDLEATGGLPGMLLTAADVHENANLNRAVDQAKAALETIKEDERKVSTNNLRWRSSVAWPFQPTESCTKKKNNSNKEKENSGIRIMGPPGLTEYLHSLGFFLRRERFKVFPFEGASRMDLFEFSKAASKKEAKQKKKGGKKESTPLQFTIQSLPFTAKQPASCASASRKRPRSPSTTMESLPALQEVSPPSEEEEKSSLDGRTQECCGHRTQSYWISTPAVAGKFLVDQAKTLGIPPGPLFGQLKEGKSVTFTNSAGESQTVESHQVVAPTVPGVGILVLKYPQSATEVERFFCELDLATFFASKAEKESVEVALIVHIAGKEALDQNSRWMEKLAASEWKNVDHLWVDTNPFNDQHGTPHEGAALTARTRSILCPSIYCEPLRVSGTALDHDNRNKMDAKQQSEPATTVDEDLNSDQFRQAVPRLLYQFLPRAKKGFSMAPTSAESQTMEELEQVVEGTGAMSAAQEALSLESEKPPPDHAEEQEATNNGSEEKVGKEGQLFFTGTASAIPCKHRNVSGMCLMSPDGRSILLDVGEGTVGQLLRSAPSSLQQTLSSSSSLMDEIQLALGNIKAVFISHPHADHHLGLVRLLLERKHAVHGPVVVIAPPGIREFLKRYTATVNASLEQTYQFLDCAVFLGNSGRTPHAQQDALAILQSATGLTHCTTVRVEHCANAYGVVLDGTCFGRVVYSGDCRPSRRLVQAGQDANLLIHEATFENGMEQEAFLKRHSTVGEALRVGRDMRARHIILTHFSQRYPKSPPPPLAVDIQHAGERASTPWEEETRVLTEDSMTMPVIYAFDYMRVTPSTLVLASRMTRAVRLLFANDAEAALAQEGTTTPLETESGMDAGNALAIPGLFAQKELL